MKSTFSILALLIIGIGISCQEDSDFDPGPCTLEDPILQFKIEPEKVIVTWDKVNAPEADSYTIGIRLASEVDETDAKFNGGSQVDISATSYEVFNRFMPGTKYYAAIGVADKESRGAPYMNHCHLKWQPFTTPCAPFKFRVDDIKSNTALVSWDKSDFKLFTINLRKKGTTNVELFSTDQNKLQLSGLSSSTEYQVQSVYTCIDNQTYISDWKDFKTL